MSHSNISIFIPHLGCPFQCIFCNQFKITGSDSAVTPLDVYNLLTDVIKNDKLVKGETQIAFFGGSFTAIDKQLMAQYLEAANKFVGDGKFSGIRISTRPDCIDTEILDILKKYNVTTIELGIQSFDGKVLEKSKRGYDSLCAINSCRLIQRHGFELGLQMMCGLPGDTFEKDVATAQKIIELGCKQVRIYPVVVLNDTQLCLQYESHEYTPLSVDDAVKICAKLYSLFKNNDVTILKVGLHSDSGCVAGPFHPAFGELVRSEVFYNEVYPQLIRDKLNVIRVAPTFVSIAIGNSKRNMDKFKTQGFDVKIISDTSIKQKDWIL